jgi:hypothetical protein
MDLACLCGRHPRRGLVYDGTREDEAPNLAPLYLVGVAIALIAVLVGMQDARRRRQ